LSLVKVGGKLKTSDRHHDATHYDRKYYDTDSAQRLCFSWNPHRQQASSVARAQVDSVCYSLGLGVNDNRSSPKNMATLTGSPYSRSNPGCVYLVPVHATIATQAHYFKVHVSHHLVVKQLIAGGDQGESFLIKLTRFAC
jgi:hypothetical protein